MRPSDARRSELLQQKRAEMDRTVKQWLASAARRSVKAEETSDALFHSFSKWNGYEPSRIAFATAMTRAGFGRRRRTTGHASCERVYVGVRLK